MLNAISAINYNKDRNYNQQAIGSIQFAVGADTSGFWDTQTVEAIYDWQMSKNGKLVGDGKVGPATLGYLIGELDWAGYPDQSAILRQFPHKLQSKGGNDGDLNPIVQFTQWTSMQPKFGRFREKGVDHWIAEGSFHVLIKLNPLLTENGWVNFEYRQEISGNAWVQSGSWDASNTIWTMSGPQKSINHCFQIPVDPNKPNLPKGLTGSFKEDGLNKQIAGKPFRFGYRDGTQEIGPKFASHWVPDGNGPDFLLQDTFGYSEAYNGDAPKVHLEINYRGIVVETAYDDNTDSTKVIREVKEKRWAYRFENILRWSETK